MKTTVQILEEARELLSDESRWTKGVVARKENGKAVLPNHPEAYSFCALGVIAKVADVSTGENLYYPAMSILRNVMGQTITFFNDAPERKHSEVLEAFDKAIALAKEQECS